MEHPAEIFNKIKNIAFALYHKDGFLAALKFIDGEYSSLGPRGYVGLKAELCFYDRNKDTLALTPSLDYGIKCDFSGAFDGRICRFDVTTNLNCKHLKDYESIQSKTSIPYKIAVVNYKTGVIEDVFDINFPIDESGQGRLFDVLIFNHGDSNSQGEYRHNPYQEIFQVNSYTPMEDVKLIDTLTDWYIPDIHTYKADLLGNADDEDDSYWADKIEKDVNQYIIENAKFLSKESGRNIVACGQRCFRYIGKDGDGEYYTKIYWQHPVIEGYLPNELDIVL